MNTNFVNNTVHSCPEHGVVFRGAVGGDCFAASGIRAYKNLGLAATGMENGGPKAAYGFYNTKWYDMTFIDNAKGFMALGSNQFTGGRLSTLMLDDIKVYGEYAPILDCPDITDESYCFNKSKTAWGINGYTRDSRGPMEE